MVFEWFNIHDHFKHKMANKFHEKQSSFVDYLKTGPEIGW